MGEAKPEGKISIADYLEMEERSEFKYEFHDGEVFAMAGGSIPHGEISSNVHNFLKNEFRSRGGKCRSFNSDIKVFIEDANTFVYPDASAVCGKIEEHEKGQGYHNPTLIVEVLSDSTESYDRGEKFRKYRKITSLREYVLINQSKPEIEIFYRPEKSDLWKISTYEGLDASVSLESVELEIPMRQIYLDVF